MVRGAVDGEVVHQHKHAVGGLLHIGLDAVVHGYLGGLFEGQYGVFRIAVADAPVRFQFEILRPGGERCRQGEEENR